MKYRLGCTEIEAARPGTLWELSNRADPRSCQLANRHYSRQNPDSKQFVPPGRCIVLWQRGAVWVTSWPYAQFVKHAWAGAWINSLFRREQDCTELASDLIRQAIAITRSVWDAPPQGIVTFIDVTAIKSKRDPGRCYRRAGFTVVGHTKGGLLALQMLPCDMPQAIQPYETHPSLYDNTEPVARPEEE